VCHEELALSVSGVDKSRVNMINHQRLSFIYKQTVAVGTKTTDEELDRFK